MSKSPHRFMTPACLRSGCAETQERRASWMELFYDLVFVVAISAMAELLYTHSTWLGLAQFALLFVSLWCAWTANTFYATRFDTDDPYHRLMFLAQMLCIALIAAYSEKTFASTSRYYAIVYSCLCLIIIALYTRVCIALPKVRPMIVKLLAGICSSTSFWVVSIFLPTPWRYYCWIIAMIIFLVTPTVLRRTLQQSHAALSASHLPERFALFTIIVLGEAVASVIYGIEFHGITQVSIVASVLSMLFAFGVWWLYFENIEIDLSTLSFMSVIRWEFSHLFLVLAITVLSVAIRHCIEHDVAISLLQANLLGAAVALIFISVGQLQNIRRQYERHTYLIIAVLSYLTALTAHFYRPAYAITALVVLVIIANRQF